MEIPTEFQIFGHTVEVIHDDKLDDKRDVAGLAELKTNKIILNDYSGRPHSHIEQVYWHEVIHYAFHHLSYQKLCDDEALVDQLASVIHQVVTTSVYNKKVKKKKTRK